MKYLNTKTGEVTSQIYFGKRKVYTKDSDLYKLIELSTNLVSLVIRFFMRDKQVPSDITIGGVTGWLQIEFIYNKVSVSYKRHNEAVGYFRYFEVDAPTEKEARQKMYDLLKEKGLLW